MRVRVGHIQTEVIYQLHLLFLPLRPTVLAHLFADLLPKLGRHRRMTDRLVLLPAAGAFEFVPENSHYPLFPNTPPRPAAIPPRPPSALPPLPPPAMKLS